MKIRILDDYSKLSAEAAKYVACRIEQKSNLVLGLATGSTPLGMYKQLIKLYQLKQVSFSQVTTFNLDEYYPIAREIPHSYYSYMRENLWNRVDIRMENTNIPDGNPVDALKVCLDYEARIEEVGGIDLQVLGIGENGHIGFNEPGASLSANTHLVKLSEDTIKANSRFFVDINDVPKQAITMGMGTIMKAKEIILLAAGESKAEIIKETLTGVISTQIPASMLQVHPRVTVLLDKGAGKLI
ncbi:MAG: glucosamine-6-phosphate deaminase [Desulfitibacter sp. BRH_c19]|nr:MAG: glucosamine-6-phosphate deaminase [Desulfitibacter sp. BRH_c19]